MKASVSIIAATFWAAAATSVAGISGGGAAANGISGGGAPAATTLPGEVQLLVVGPIESIDVDTKIVVVLGQRVAAPTLNGLAVGDMAAIFGKLRSDGAILVDAIQARGPYVAGASSVLISGVVQKTDSMNGRAVINGIAVDLTPMMAQGVFSPVAGSKLQIGGIQPLSRGVVIANGISGGGAAANGISGGGAPANGISGGGYRANGISGGGAAANGISGGGAAANGISGGGAAANGISGGGAAANGISGGGAPANGISGGGAPANGISGGDYRSGIILRVSGVSGGGAAANGISGGGYRGGVIVRASGISGGGYAANGVPR